MLSYMNDGAHDDQHIYRVLYFVLDIAGNYEVDLDVLIASALLHDIGRDAQFNNNKTDHALVGSEIAYAFIKKLGWNEEKAIHIKKCISTHRYRKSDKPESIEAKILFDTDK
ncbi:MAG: HD domain-containing protein [Chitinispirillia bacterium]